MRVRKLQFVLLFSLCLASLATAAVAEERGMGVRPPTPEEKAYCEARYQKVTQVAANDLARTRVAEETAAERPTSGLPTLPAAVDNSTLQYFPPIRSQGSQGSCTAWASGYYYNTYTQAMDEGYDVSGGDNDHINSPAFLYNLVNMGEDWGAWTEYVVLRLTEVGCSSWAQMPYSSGDWTTWPSETAWVEALRNRSETAQYIDGSTTLGMEAIKQLLSNGRVLVTDFDVYSTWYDYYPETRTGIDNSVYYYPDGSVVGGHAVTIVGYDDSKSYVDHRDGLTHHGAFLLANSWGTWWGVQNTGGQSGFFWVAYSMFTESTFGPYVYYTEDRPDYRPRLYAAIGVNHPERWDVIVNGQVSGSSLWTSYDAVWYDGGALPITDERRIAIDLTEGIPYLGTGSPTLTAQVYNWEDSAYTASITSADFYADLDGDGTYFTYLSGDPPLTVTQGQWGSATVLLLGEHALEVNVEAPDPEMVVSEGATSLAATAADSHGHEIATWAWSDGGAGGSFYPSSSVPSPTYTAPENTSWEDLLVTLTVTATCSGSPALSDSASTELTVLPASEGRFVDEGAIMNLPTAIGGAWGDYDSDGYADLYTGAMWGNHRCVLWHNNGDGTFSDVTYAMGLHTDSSYWEDWGAAWGDYNNDGRLDLLVTGGNHSVFLYRNDGSGFTDVGGAAAGFVYYPTQHTASWADYDGDNWLDVYICYNLSDVSRLYRNNQDGTFTEVTNAAGMEFSQAGLGNGSAWGDYNNDGPPDLLVAREWSGGYANPPRLYRNHGDGTFNDMGTYAGLLSVDNTVGAAWGDYDNDGWLDFYMTPGHGRPHWLFHNDWDDTFTDVSMAAGIGNFQTPGAGVAWADYDNDGWLDIAVANSDGQRVMLYRNHRDGTFTDRGGFEGVTAVRHGRAAAWADYDRDGRMDLFIAANPPDTYSCLYHNTAVVGNHLRVRALTDSDGDTSDFNTTEDRDALGARVEVNLDNDPTFLPGRTLLRFVDGGSGFCGQSEPVAQFGLGASDLVAVRVGFPDGSIVVESDVAVNQQIAIGDIATAVGTVRGVVRELISGAPVSGEPVSCDFLTTFTAPDGSYEIATVPAGPGHVVRAGGLEFEYATVTGVTVPVAAAVTVDLYVIPEGYGAVTGTVTDANTLGPISGAIVSCGNPNPTDQDGEYLFYVPEGENYTVSAAATGYVTEEVTGVTIAGGQVVQTDFSLAPELYGAIAGRVTNRRTAVPVIGATVRACYGEDLSSWYETTTDEAGDYALSFTPTQHIYTLLVSAPGYYDYRQEGVTVEQDQTTTVDVPLAPEFTDVSESHWAYTYIGACVQAGIVSGYDDGTYRPSLVVTRDQMAVYISRAIAGGDTAVPTGPLTATFSDVPTTHWAYRYVEYAVANGIVTGYSDGTYRPTSSVDRGQMSVFTSRSICTPRGEAGLADYVPPTTPTFSDVPATFWAFKYVEYAAAHSVVGGYSDGTYRPNNPCTRDQMAVFVSRAFNLL